jgi:hypothetical protein
MLQRDATPRAKYRRSYPELREKFEPTFYRLSTRPDLRRHPGRQSFWWFQPYSACGQSHAFEKHSS